ncbi:MAG TPA: hypothetical protein VN541_14055 [Tepidisphaeraceae bacterium]|nr:hypothetical protein [Tepidisphaeraceae bacterium]
MKPDYPAAHSMDTEWFAVDKNGNVALCKSGEPGPKPIGVPYQTDVVWDVLPRLFFARAQLVLGRHASPDDWFRSTGMLLPASVAAAEIEPFKPEIGEPIQTDSGVLRPVFFNDIDDEGYRQLHDRGICQGCIGFGFGVEWKELAEMFGLFFFDASDDWQNGPYRRLVVPAQPTRSDQLALSESEAQSVAQFPAVDFLQTPVLQPLEHLSCDVWGGFHEGDTYLASDLKTLRPLPPPTQTDK